MTSACEIWVATALLHFENPGRRDFTVGEIVARAVAENPAAGFRSRLSDCVITDGVATNAPETVDSCVLTATGKDRRRLYRHGDSCHPRRVSGSFPKASDLPSKYHFLLTWYRDTYLRRPPATGGLRFAIGAA
jgi:hypothetical protein